MATFAEGILVLHSQRPGVTPAVLAESSGAFAAHSRFPVWTVNTYFGFPEGLAHYRFRVIVLHYSLFYDAFSPITAPFLAYLETARASHLVAMFQDEQAYLGERIAFCDRYTVDCVYTTIEPPHCDRLYSRPTRAVVSYIPGHVSDRLRTVARRRYLSDARRPIDIGYRGRRSPAEWGAAAQEKYEIGVRFRERARNSGLQLDIESDEDSRIYGRAWYQFIAACRGMLGTESGTGAIPYPPEATIPDKAAKPIPYRTISPRHLEAAAFRTCQILYRGRYSGLLEPMVHYIPLEKDFSNFDAVLEAYRSAELRTDLTANAFRDLIADPCLTYATFVTAFDRRLEEAGAAPRPRRNERRRVAWIAGKPHIRRAGNIAITRAWCYTHPRG